MDNYINNIDISSMIDTFLKVIVPAYAIKEGSTVTKKTGTKQFTLKRNLKIYGTAQKEIKCDVGMVFLVDADGNINMIGQDTELVALVYPENLAYDINYSFEENK